MKAATELVEVDNCKIKADNLLQIAGNANRLYKEVEALKQDIQIIEDELKFSGSTRTLSDVQKELEELADKR
jgi:DNA repair protein RAD50